MTRKNKQDYSMIQVKKTFLPKLKKFKIHPRQSYEELIESLLKNKKVASSEFSITENTQEKIQRLNSDLFFKTGTKRTAEEIINMALDFFKINYKGEKLKKLAKEENK